MRKPGHRRCLTLTLNPKPYGSGRIGQRKAANTEAGTIRSRVWGLGFGVWSLGFWVLGFRV